MIKTNKYLILVSIILLHCIILFYTMRQYQDQINNRITKSIGTIINQKWSAYNYKTNYKLLHKKRDTIMFKSTINQHHVIYVKNDLIVKEEYYFHYCYTCYSKIFELDRYILSHNPTKTEGSPKFIIPPYDYRRGEDTPELIYYFDRFYIKIRYSYPNRICPQDYYYRYKITFFSENTKK